MFGHARHRAQREDGADERGDVVRLDLLLVRKPGPLGHPRRHEPGRDRGRADAMALLLPVERVRECDQRRLRRTVDREPRRRDRSGDRGERDHLTSRRAQERERLPRDDERRPQVDVELERDALRVLLRERSTDSDPRRVHEHVHAAVAGGVCRDHACTLLGLREVCGDGERVELRSCSLERLGPAGDERERESVVP